VLSCPSCDPDHLATNWQQHWPCHPNAAIMSTGAGSIVNTCNSMAFSVSSVSLQRDPEGGELGSHPRSPAPYYTRRQGNPVFRFGLGGAGNESSMLLILRYPGRTRACKAPAALLPHDPLLKTFTVQLRCGVLSPAHHFPHCHMAQEVAQLGVRPQTGNNLGWLTQLGEEARD